MTSILAVKQLFPETQVTSIEAMALEAVLNMG